MRQFVILISMCINGINSCGMMLSKLVLRPIKPDNYPLKLVVVTLSHIFNSWWVLVSFRTKKSPELARFFSLKSWLNAAAEARPR